MALIGCQELFITRTHRILICGALKETSAGPPRIRKSLCDQNPSCASQNVSNTLSRVSINFGRLCAAGIAKLVGAPVWEVRTPVLCFFGKSPIFFLAGQQERVKGCAKFQRMLQVPFIFSLIRQI